MTNSTRTFDLKLIRFTAAVLITLCTYPPFLELQRAIGPMHVIPMAAAEETHPKRLVIHHTGMSGDEQLDRVNRAHERRWGLLSPYTGKYVVYHYFIGRDGTIVQTRDLSERTGHTMNGIVNDESISIVVAGNFQTDELTRPQAKALRSLISQLDRRFHFETIIPHGDASATECPGEKLEKALKDVWRGFEFTPETARMVPVLKKAGFSGEGLRVAYAVMKAESRGDPKAFNGKGQDLSYGLFQINMLGKLGPDRRAQHNLKKNEDLYDPLTNAKIAHHMSGGGKSWAPWSTYRSGAYRPYLAEFDTL